MAQLILSGFYFEKVEFLGGFEALVDRGVGIQFDKVADYFHGFHRRIL